MSVDRIKPLIPKALLNYYRIVRRFYRWKRQKCLYYKAVRRIKDSNRPLNVIFLVLYSSVWKYDSVYQLMEKDSLFNPLILVCPVMDCSIEQKLAILNTSYDDLYCRGYNVRKAFNEKTGVFVEIDSLNPDILFYSSQWDVHYDIRYQSYTLNRYLKCYVNYTYNNVPFEWSIASQFQGRMWMYFSECEDNMKLALSFNQHEFNNMRVVGYPMYDEIISTKETGRDWKVNNKNLKRIIWAPHHTIPGRDGLIKFSTFLEYADIMLSLADKFKNEVQFVFKPHPQLIDGLYNYEDWGRERTDEYYKKWADGENTAIVNGTYVDLFKSSDAMIHDCGSFLLEYLYTQKPVMYLSNNSREVQSNSVGKRAYFCHYHGITADDIENFIIHVVIQGKDTMIEKRKMFYEDVLVPPNGCSVAENIVKEIKIELGK